MMNAAERPLIVAGGGVINAMLQIPWSSSPSSPARRSSRRHGLGRIPDDHPLMAGMVGLQTSHRYGNRTFLKSNFVLGIGNRWANRHTGSIDVYTKGRQGVHVDIEPTQIGRVFGPDFGIVSDAKVALELFIEVARDGARGQARGPQQMGGRMRAPQAAHAAPHAFRPGAAQAPAVYQEMNEAFGRDICYVTTIGLSQIAGAQFPHVYQPRNWINCAKPARSAGPLPAALGVRAADPERGDRGAIRRLRLPVPDRGASPSGPSTGCPTCTW